MSEKKPTAVDKFSARAGKLFKQMSKKTQGSSSELPLPSQASQASLPDVPDAMAASGKSIGHNLSTLLAQTLYSENSLQAPDACPKPSATSAEAMLTDSGLPKSQVSPAMVSFVHGINMALNEDSFKAQIEAYVHRRAEQLIQEQANEISSRGEKMGGMVLSSLSKMTAASVAPDTTPPDVPQVQTRAVAEGAAPAKGSIENLPDSPEFEDGPCIDPVALGVPALPLAPTETPKSAKKEATTKDMVPAVTASKNPDLLAALLRPLISGMNSKLKRAAVADRALSALSLDAVKDLLSGMLYDKYTRKVATYNTDLEEYGTLAGGKLLEYLSGLDEVENSEESEQVSSEELAARDAELAHAIAQDDRNIDGTLLGPILEPLLAGLIKVMRGSQYRGQRLDALSSLAKVLFCPCLVGKK